MFRRLQTKLTVLYAALLGAAFILVAGAVYGAVVNNAERLVRQELEASGTVFDQIWSLRSRQLQDTAAVLARDFGFRSAIATHDDPTVQSALANLSGRLNLDLAVIVGVDGVITTIDGRDLGDARDDLLSGLDREEGPTGVLMVDGVAYQVVSAPILTPLLQGWVVFGAKLDGGEMTALERLAAIPLDATVMTRRGGAWESTTSAMTTAEAQSAARFLDSVSDGRPGPMQVDTAEGGAIAAAKPLRSVSGAHPFVLMLRYPLARALAPYRPLINAILATGVLGAVVLLVGSFLLARSVTRPITALDEASRRLMRGEDASVKVETKDEIGRLAESFNVMASEILERERRLEGALGRAEAANRLTSEFLANMSHEIRTPLNGVLGLSQVLARATNDPAQRELTAAIIHSAGALERLLCDILEAAQLRAGAAELHAEPFALRPAVEAAAEPWRMAAVDKGLALSVEVDPAVDTVIIGDSARIQQILNAILSNAVKFTAQGEIRLRALPCDRGLRLEVADTGCGIDADQKERLFAAFQQVDGSSTRRQGGVGLGLSVAQGFVELMGGVIDCAPRAEGGSLFWIELPLDRPAPAQRVA